MGDLDQVRRVIVLSMIVNDLATGLIVFQDRQGVLQGGKLAIVSSPRETIAGTKIIHLG